MDQPKTAMQKTNETLSSEVKSLKLLCKGACQLITNNPSIELNSTGSNSQDEALAYVERLRAQIENSSTPLISDNLLHTQQFLMELTEKTKQAEEIIAFKKGVISDLDIEIQRLQSQIKMVQDAMAHSRPKKQEISVEQIMKAKQKFVSLKTEMHDLIETYFCKDADDVREVLGDLTQLDADEYMKISLQNCRVIALLIDLNIVSKNPYNEEEVKLVH